MSVRQHRQQAGQARTRKGQSRLVRTSRRHESLRDYRRLRAEEQAEILDEWFDEYENGGIWK